MKKRLVSLLLVAALSLAACGKPVKTQVEESQETETSVAVQETETEEEEPQPQTIELVMVGDVLMHDRVLYSGQGADGSYNFDHLFAHVSDKAGSADLALINEETILGGTELGISAYPCFNSPYEVGDAEANAGFDLILSATNHALDRGKQGILNCISFWETKHPDQTIIGIYDSQEDSDNIYIYEKDGMKIAILNYTYDTNGISTPDDMPYCVNYLEESQVRADLEQANALADFVVVCPHWGTEYQLEASEEQREWCNIFLECGVDLVIGTHPHVIEPMEWYEDGAGNRMLVYYSLGNFVNGTEQTGYGIANRMVGGMADITLGRDSTGQVTIMEASVIPLVCHEGTGTEYTVYYLSDYTQEMAQANWIVDSDSEFSLQYCYDLVAQVWGITY